MTGALANVCPMGAGIKNQRRIASISLYWDPETHTGLVLELWTMMGNDA